ncbi:YXWGXW repeat-containing protein [Corallococcus sp. EGB]|uniref:YXWGXW repeat-containing protein n=1 Tax=Corallococcus sp. EGB TaxID=1521117 RepID=UPI0021056C46|nr:YXWGXW repeat-containing protein [Corallococcus sp. EGB]
MGSRWWVGLIVGLATQGAFAQTSPVAADDWEDDEYAQQSNAADDSGPIAPTAPPDLPAESPTPRPYAGAVWTSGHWYWDGDSWQFKSGGWVERMPGYQYINGYWAQDGDVWRWVSGGWAQEGSNEVEIPIEVASEDVTATQAPPALRVESQPPAPAPDYVWAPGYWYWGANGYEWVSGTWMEPPRPGLVFVSPHWVRRGPSWVFVGGGWGWNGSVRVIVPVYRHAHIALSFGRPNLFLRSWYRYPGVSWRYYGYGYHRYRPGYYSSYSRPGPYRYGPRVHDASPGRYNGPSYGGRGYSHPGPYRSQGGGVHSYNNGGGNSGGWGGTRSPPPGGRGTSGGVHQAGGWGGGSGGPRPASSGGWGGGSSSGVHQSSGGHGGGGGRWGGGSGGGNSSHGSSSHGGGSGGWGGGHGGGHR